MPKKRVYEVARELKIDNKTLLNELNRMQISVKSHSSNLEESDIKKVMEHFTEQKTTGNQNSGAAKPEQVRTEDRGAERAGENPQNTAPQNRTPVPAEQNRPRPEGEGRPRTAADGERRPRPEGERRPRPEGERRPRPEGERRPRPEGERRPRPEGERRPRPEGERRPRPEGDRGPRPEGDRGPRPEGDRGPRPEGDRGPRPEGDRRPPRPEGDRRPRPEGERRPYNNDRPQGQGGYNNNRPQGQSGSRPQGQGGYNNNRPQGQGGYNNNRPQGQGGYNNSRPQGQGGYNNSRPQGQGGYTNSRPQGQGGYNNSRPQGQGGYNNSRPQGQGGYNNNRPQGQGGNRPQGQGGYNNNRPQGGYNNNRGGYQGRPQGGGGYDKDKDSRDNNNRNFSSRPKAPATTTTTTADKPDKYQRQQKLEASRRNDRRGKGMERDNEKKALTRMQKKANMPAMPTITMIKIPKVLTVKELAEEMRKSGAEVIKMLMKHGEMLTINSEIDFEIAEKIAMEYNILVEEEIEVDAYEQVFGNEQKDDESIMTERPPVVVVMGHVDHGKTSLLDAIRNAHVTAGEAGGITQHIGAYTVAVNDKPITFIDTPGHEAFTSMRMRGAQVTDIAILVVAADDGVMPQTVEAISHAKAAGVEIIVAINKMDKPSANPDRVKQELIEHGLVAEDWGGDTICVPVSAATREGLDTLLDMILLVAEMKEYKANPGKEASGTVIEALLDKGKGPVATVLVQNGTLHIGDPIVAGTVFGKIRAMMDDKGRRVKKAGPSIPVEVLGLSEVPAAGDLFHVAANDKQARQVAEGMQAKARREITTAGAPQRVTLDDLFAQIQAGNIKELNVIIKADVQGTAQAVKASLEKLSNEEVRVRTILDGVGAVTESDVMLAAASNAIIIGFNVRPEPAAKAVAEENKVDLRLYRVIYNAIEDIQTAMKGMLDPVYEEKVIGHAEIRQIFKASSVGNIGGGYVTDGTIKRNSQVRIVRDGVVVYEGTLDTLRRFKDDVKEVNSGYECGLLFNKFNDIKEGDVVEAFFMEEIKR